jgi:hypothetical protein
LFKYERHLIAGAFVVAFIMNPTPNVVDQLLVVLPIIVTYQLGIGLVWLSNRSHNPEWLAQLREQDAQRQAERASRPLEPFVISGLPQVPEEPETEDPVPPPAEPMPIPPHTERAYTSNLGTPTRRNYLPLRGQAIQ